MQVSSTPWPKRRGVFVCALVFALWLSFLSACAEDQPASLSNCAQLEEKARSETAQVELARVVDGDTLKLKDGRKVRVVAINTPEMVFDTKQPEPFAKEATEAVKAFLRGGSFLLIPALDSKDNYGRTLAYVYNLQGQNLSAHLLAQGLGWHIAVPPNLKLAKCLSTIEAEARSKKLGLWNLSPTLSTEIRRGGFQHIEARIRDISFGKPGEPWWVHLDNSLLAVIYPENQQYFDRTRLASLKGRRVEIRGWVYPDRRHTDRWRIKLETPFAIASPF